MQESSPLEEMRLSIQHPIIQAPLVRLIEQQVEILERLGDPERLGRILQGKNRESAKHTLRSKQKRRQGNFFVSHTSISGAALVTSSIALLPNTVLVWSCTAVNISQPRSRQYWSPVMRYM
jgi:hypothetical protein